jgi:hypothetical protein
MMRVDQLDKENADLNEKNDLLSPADWIMFLSWEIYDEKNTNGPYNTTPIIALLVAFAFSVMSLMFAALSSDLPDETVKDILVALNFGFYIVAIIMLCFVGYISFCIVVHILHSLGVRPKAQKRVDALEKIRDELLSGTLKEYNEIYRRYKRIEEHK